MLLDIFSSDPFLVITHILVLFGSLVMHEFAHAKAADSLGDPTPRLQGRLTLNPMAHLDPIGTLLILFTGFGWGRPVRFDPYNLAHPRQDGMKIALAGPASNIALALFVSLLYKIVQIASFPIPELGASVMQIIIITNISLAIFNLIPIEPLDGFKIVAGLLPEEQVASWESLRPYGMFFLFALLLPLAGGSSPLSLVLNPVMHVILNILL